MGGQYEGMWCHADREGRLEDCPRQLKVMIFPYHNFDPEKALKKLASLKSKGRPFILRYEHDGEHYIQILQWTKYQRIHNNERASTIPGPNGKLVIFKDKDKEKDKDKDKGQTPSCPSNSIPNNSNSIDTDAQCPSISIEQEFIASWNATSLPKIALFSEQRRDKFKARIQSDHFKTNWKKALEKLAASSFALGKVKNWKATVDWFIANDTNYIKALEGKYDDKIDPFAKWR